MNLFNLTDSQLKLKELLENAESDEDLQVARDTYEAIDLSLEDKLMGYWYVYKEFKAQETALKEAKASVDKKLKATRNKMKRLAQSVQDSMEATEKKKVTDGVGTLRLQKNPPSVTIHDTDSIPKKYLIEQQPKIDRMAIKKAIQDGEEVPGAELAESEGVRFV